MVCGSEGIINCENGLNVILANRNKHRSPKPVHDHRRLFTTLPGDITCRPGVYSDSNQCVTGGDCISSSCQNLSGAGRRKSEGDIVARSTLGNGSGHPKTSCRK